MSHDYCFILYLVSYKGCEKTEVDCKIVNHACPEHHQVIKDISSKKQSDNKKKYNALKRAK